MFSLGHKKKLQGVLFPPLRTRSHLLKTQQRILEIMRLKSSCGWYTVGGVGAHCGRGPSGDFFLFLGLAVLLFLSIFFSFSFFDLDLVLLASGV